MTLTIEELKYGAEVGDLGIDAVRAVCDEALAIREAQLVLCVDMDSDFIKHIQKCSEEVAKWPEWKRRGADVTEFTSPPAPAVPGIDELRLAFERAERDSDDGFNLHKYGIGYEDWATQARWESCLSCRAAMLGGNK